MTIRSDVQAISVVLASVKDRQTNKQDSDTAR